MLPPFCFTFKHTSLGETRLQIRNEMEEKKADSILAESRHYSFLKSWKEKPEEDLRRSDFNFGFS